MRVLKLDEGLKRGINKKNAFTADSLGELAEKIEVNTSVLTCAIDEYNTNCSQQHDAHFAKAPAYSHPIEEPPYYAIKCTYHIFTTLGGIRINHKTEVVDENQEVIHGLYSTGNCAGGMYGEDYEVFSSGGALSFALSSGRIAGKNVLQYIGM